MDVLGVTAYIPSSPGMKPPSTCPLYPCPPVTPVGVHRLVESISALQGERNKLLEEITGLRQQLEEGEKEKQQLAGSFDLQYVTQTVEVESPTTLRSLVEAEERNRGLLEQLQGSEEVTAGLRHKISAYESEISKLREELLREISHLEAQKEEAVKEASESSEQHLEQLREQLTGTAGLGRGWGSVSEGPCSGGDLEP
ncbi:cobalt ABC transporter ATP-binding protein [Platysternon megacephalum]|uniref:Cobalt ABC transporter ATP-binding protein n=1 Tax=Platysternon megacephalum TaxID=55544 RepID=A0A4D9DKZ7_9SAUR|nr:cobalt ABC transporter ATP-binding protein [Platysternon megacephalum]